MVKRSWKRASPDDAESIVRAARAATLPLGELLVAMRSESAIVREAAWAACYERYHRTVWSYALYVMRSIPWLHEPREAAADVASDVFVGLPDAAKHYREEGRAEWWLKQVTVRAALRRREALTGMWASGRKPAAADAPDARARSYVPFDETADQIVARLDDVDPDELLELRRRREALRESPDPVRRRWDEFLELYIAGYGFDEIGAHLGLTSGTARNWLSKIRKHLSQSHPTRDRR